MVFDIYVKKIMSFEILNLMYTCLGLYEQRQKNTFSLKISDFEDKSLLIVDDDDPFRDRLARAMEKKGFQVKDQKPLKML